MLREYMTKIFEKPLAITSQLSGTEPLPKGQNRVQEASNVVNAKPRLLDNLSVLDLEAHPSAVNAPIRAESREILNRPVRSTRASRPITVDLEDFEDQPEIERFSVKHGLGAPWKKPLNYNSGRRRAVVDFKDLERLDDGQFLNDQLIDFYLLYLFDQAKVPRDKVYLFNTHFFTTLARKVPGQKGTINYQGVARWTAKEDIFGYDYIVVPINQDIHWFLAIICNVSNIARTPAIEDATRSEGDDLTTCKGLESKPEAKDEDLQSIPPPALLDPPEPPRPFAVDEIIDPDDSDLNLVDPRATGPDHGLSVPSGSSSVAASPATETAQMKRLSLSDTVPESIVLSSASSAGPKKARRKRPPLRKRDPNEPVIIVLDSLGGSAKSSTMKVLRDYIKEEGREKRGMDANIAGTAVYAKEGQIPQQQNYVDCGVHLLGYAQQFFENPDLFKNRLLSNEMQLEAHWPDITMSSMRTGMRDILQRLHREQEADREKTRKLKKQTKKSSPIVTADAAKGSIDHQAAIPEPAETPMTTIGVTKMTTASETNNAPNEEKVSPVPSTQALPRLASPFQVRAPRERDRSRSNSVPAPTPIDDVSDVLNQVLSTVVTETISPVEIPRRSKSPIVLIRTPAANKSPKRPQEAILVEDSPEKITKKARTNRRTPADYLDSDPQIISVRSPGAKVATLLDRHEKDLTGTRGSSRDPIQLDEPQEVPESMSTATQSTKDHSEGLDLIVSPKITKGTKISPARQRQQQMSSPARSPIQRKSPRQRRETQFANESPDPIADFDDDDRPQRVYSRAFSPRSQRPKWGTHTSDDESPGKGMEVPETPPHDG